MSVYLHPLTRAEIFAAKLVEAARVAKPVVFTSPARFADGKITGSNYDRRDMEIAILRITALLALVPAAVIVFRRMPRRDILYWIAFAVAIAGTSVWVYVRQSTGWSTGISTALWLTILACLVFYLILSLTSEQGWRLAVLLLPYLLILGVLATLWGQAPERPLVGGAPLAWIGVHIIVSVATYGLITLAAVSSLSAAVQERALKTKSRSNLSASLPSVADSETLSVRLLAIAEIVLLIGLITGMATQFLTTGIVLVADHKTTFTFLVFIVIGALLIFHHRYGVRGRTATRIILLIYLMLTLAYPGVKFVTDILIAT